MAIDVHVEIKNKETKSKQNLIYDLAYMTAVFVGKVFNGSTLPKIEEIFPEEQKEEPEEVIDNSWIIIKERMIDFANEANKRRKNK